MVPRLLTENQEQANFATVRWVLFREYSFLGLRKKVNSGVFYITVLILLCDKEHYASKKKKIVNISKGLVKSNRKRVFVDSRVDVDYRELEEN